MSSAVHNCRGKWKPSPRPKSILKVSLEMSDRGCSTFTLHGTAFSKERESERAVLEGLPPSYEESIVESHFSERAFHDCYLRSSLKHSVGVFHVLEAPFPSDKLENRIQNESGHVTSEFHVATQLM